MTRKPAKWYGLPKVIDSKMREEIIGIGAEALLIRRGDILLKRRVKKNYRHECLDLYLRKSRTRHEARLLRKLSQVVHVPRVIGIDGIMRKGMEPETEIAMEFIKGILLSEGLDKLPKSKVSKVCEQMGTSLALLHDRGIIHGDLTTSNMILKENDLFLIDFGLGFHSDRIEDKAVDLHLLREALEARHFVRWEDYFKSVIKGYNKTKDAEKVIERLKKVESRGRYKNKGQGKEI